jgi:predicted P-loop ATPase
MDRKTGKEDRTYAVAPFPVGSIPKVLRPAFTSPFPGHVLIDLDWKASHWQILAFQSQDATLIADLRAGDLYTSLFPGIERKVAKAALNTVLNGGGVESLTSTLGSADEARKFLDRAHELLNTRWPKAQARLRELRAQAVKEGWVTADREYAGGGVHLMRIEADFLRMACSHPKLLELGMRVVLPMHDGVLLSAPADKANEIAGKVAMVMAAYSTGSADEAKHHTATWVKWEVTSSWGGSTPQVVGQELRAAALRACASKSPAELTLAAAAMPDDLEAAMRTHHPASAEYRAIRTAMAARQAAAQWFAASTRRHAAPEVQDEATVELPHGHASYTNLCRIIRGDKTLPVARWNARESAVYLGDEEANDTLLRRTYLTALEERYGMLRVAEQTVMAAVTDVARESEYDPVRDYFDGLVWDGTSRLATWLHDYAGAQDLAEDASGRGLVRVYGQKWMLSIVARAYQPGCKVDTMLVLMGDQGARKSSLLRAIAPCGSFAAVQIDPTDKDSVLRASKVAIVEWPELAGASRREQEALKDYFSVQEDRIRPPYARGDIKIPRRVVFAATTNEDDFLRDATGSRRYWPVKVGNIDLDGVLAVKDQLWAEAVDLYRFMQANPTAPDAGTPWWLNAAQDSERARQAEHFTAEDPLQAKVWGVVVDFAGKVTVDDIMDKLDIKPTDRARMVKPVTSALKALGLTSKAVKEGGRTMRKWVHPGPFTGRNTEVNLDGLLNYN